MKKILITIFVSFCIVITFLSGNDLRDIIGISSCKDVNCGTKKTIEIEDSRSIPLENTPFWSSQTFDLSLWGTHLADITGDGYPEVITIYEQGYNYLYLNNGGVIESTPSWQSNDWDYHVWASFGDYDNDGDLDMAVASYYFAGGRTKIFRNDSGTLTEDPVWTASSGGGTWCDWGDVDNDGDLDLAIVDMFDYPSLFINDSGAFEPYPSWKAVDYNIDFGGAWIDVDGDGDLDLSVAGMNPSEPILRVYYNNGGTLEQVASWQSTLDPNQYTGGYLSVGDINQDGWLDLCHSMGNMQGVGIYSPKCVHYNQTGTLETYPSWFSSDVGPGLAAILGDINGNGYFDWAVNRDIGGGGVIYENIGDTFDPNFAWHSSTSGGLGIDLGDVDQDGIMYKEDTLISNGTKKLFYLSIQPIQKLEGITIEGNPVPLSDYCCNLKSAWVSFRDSIPTGSEIIFKYYHSRDMELLLSDYDSGKAHLFRNTNTSISQKDDEVKTQDLLNMITNPARNGRIRFIYNLSQAGVVRLSLYNCLGQEVKLLFSGYRKLGIHQFDERMDLPSGSYFLQLSVDEKYFVKKVVVLK